MKIFYVWSVDDNGVQLFIVKAPTKDEAKSIIINQYQVTNVRATQLFRDENTIVEEL